MSTRGSWITSKFRDFVDVVRASILQSSYGDSKKNSPNVSTAKVESSMNPKKFAFSFWVKWVLCLSLSVVLPSLMQNWGRLQRIEGEAEFVIEEAEKVAEVVEKVATVTGKVSEHVAEMLPEDDELKRVALAVEIASKEAVHGAQLTEQFIHKVEEVTNDMEDLESFIEPVIDKIVKKETS